MCTLRPAFTATSIETLMAKIRRGQREQRVPGTYSAELRALIAQLLALDPAQRPAARDVLQLPFLQPYIASSPVAALGLDAPAVVVRDLCVVAETDEHAPNVLVVDPGRTHLLPPRLLKPRSLINLADPSLFSPLDRAVSVPELHAPPSPGATHACGHCPSHVQCRHQSWSASGADQTRRACGCQCQSRGCCPRSWRARLHPPRPSHACRCPSWTRRWRPTAPRRALRRSHSGRRFHSGRR